MEELTDENQQGNKNKRKPKNDVKFKIQFNQEQKEAKSKILSNDIIVLTGKAGSGKTILACGVGLDLYFTRQIEKIVIIRSTVSQEDIGFLPGTADEKMQPHMTPILGNMYVLYDRAKIDSMVKDGIISIVPIAFMRGLTFTDSLIIVDEAQNVTNTQLEMIISRLGVRSKMIMCGDAAQNDFKRKSDSGFEFLLGLKNKIEGFEVFDLKQNHRHKIVDKILDEYAKSRSENR